MKDQYFGDVNDYRKYGLLRCLLSGNSLRLLVAWMLTPDDSAPDGKRTGYLKQPGKWRSYDPPLFDHLQSIVVEVGRREVRAIEQTNLLPRTAFHSDLLKDDRGARSDYIAALISKATSRAADLVFFDPDNGIEVKSKPKGRKGSRKYLYWDELLEVWSEGCSVLVYQHFPRKPREEFIREKGRELRIETDAPWVASFRTAHVLFLLAPQPRHRRLLADGARRAARQWEDQIEVRLRRGT